MWAWFKQSSKVLGEEYALRVSSFFIVFFLTFSFLFLLRLCLWFPSISCLIFLHLIFIEHLLCGAKPGPGPFIQNRGMKDQEWRLRGRLSPRQPWDLRRLCSLGCFCLCPAGSKHPSQECQPASGGPGLWGLAPSPKAGPPLVTLRPVPLWVVPAGLRLTVVWEGGLFVQSSMTV